MNDDSSARPLAALTSTRHGTTDRSDTDTTLPAGASPAHSSAPGRRRLQFTGLAAALGVVIMSTNVPTPLYSVYRQEYGFSALTLTLVFAAYALVLVPALMVFGPLTDKLGYRRVLLPALGIAAVGAALFAAASGTGWLFAARAAQGLAVGAASGALTAALVATEPRGNTRRASLLASAMTVGGGGFGPVLAGVLAQYAPARERLVYLIVLALLVPAFVVVAGLPRDMGRPAGEQPRWRPRLPGVPAGIRSAFARAAATTFLAWAVAALFLALVPSYAGEMLHTSNLALTGSIAGLILIAAGVTQLLLVRCALRAARSCGLTLLAVGLAGLVLSGALSSIGLLVAASLLAGTGQGLAFMAALRETNQIAPPERRGEVLSGFYVATYTGVGIPVVGTGLLASVTGLTTAVALFAAVIGPACLVLLALTCTPLLRDQQNTEPVH